jgi:hypothetical protein
MYTKQFRIDFLTTLRGILKILGNHILRFWEETLPQLGKIRYFSDWEALHTNKSGGGSAHAGVSQHCRHLSVILKNWR